MTEDITPRYNVAKLITYATDLLVAAGLAAPMAASVAETLVEGDLLGHDTHGLAQLPGYLKEIESGGMTKSGGPETVSDKPAAVLWDGRRLPGPWLVHRGIDLLLPRARALGSAALVIRRSHHIACLAVYMLRALEENMLLMLACSDPRSASIAPFGGTQAVFTPNPIALGFPLSDGGVMLDISASITTNGMTNRKRAAGERFEQDWLMDAKGTPSNDPNALFVDPPGTLLPIGGLDHGHKGYGLALLIEALTGGLAGHGRADPSEGWGATVYLTMHDLDAFGGRDAFLRQMDHVAARCRDNVPIDPARPVRLPGQRGLMLRAASQSDGLRLHPSIAPALAAAEQRYGRHLSDALHV